MPTAVELCTIVGLQTFNEAGACVRAGLAASAQTSGSSRVDLLEVYVPRDEPMVAGLVRMLTPSDASAVGCLVVVGGEGMGKSTLAADLCARLSQRGVVPGEPPCSFHFNSCTRFMHMYLFVVAAHQTCFKPSYMQLV